MNRIIIANICLFSSLIGASYVTIKNLSGRTIEQISWYDNKGCTGRLISPFHVNAIEHSSHIDKLYIHMQTKDPFTKMSFPNIYSIPEDVDEIIITEGNNIKLIMHKSNPQLIMPISTKATNFGLLAIFKRLIYR